MAIQNLDKVNQLDLTTNWEGYSGQQVEDVISRHLPANMSYDGSTNYLTITNANGDTIVGAEVSVAEPIYNHSIQITGIYFDSTTSENQIDKDQIICKLGTKIYLGVKYTYTATNPLTNVTNYISGAQKLYINIGGGYVQLEEGIKSSADVQYIDITKVFTKVTISTISLKVVATASIEDKTITASTPKVQVLNPKLKYAGSTYIVSSTITYTVQDGGDAKYILYYSINGGVTKNQDSLTLEIPNMGVNTIEAYVQVSTNASIKSDTLTNQIIKPADDNNQVLYAINDVAESVNNWEFSKLYGLSIYYKGSSTESVTINTKLAATGDPDEIYLSKTKEIALSSSDGYLETDISYFFGLEVTNEKFNSVLSVTSNDETVLSWEDTTTISILNTGSYSYTPNSTYSFDQYSPDESNIITKDVISKAISPDGLITDDSLTVFRLSAGNYPNNIIDLDLSNQLTNQGFTFELDFKTFNISDESKPILKLGRFVLYPTELNWQYGDVDESLVDTTAKSSIFRNDTRTHMLIEVVPSFKIPTRELVEETKSIASKTMSFVRIFINGCIDREYKYDYLSDFQYNGFKLQVSPQTADIDIYGLRVYSRALSFEEIQNNYVSTMSSITEKQQFQTLNDLVATDSNNDTYISYNKTKDLYNTLIYVLPSAYKYPQQFNLKKGDSLKNCTVFINYVNNGINDTAHKLTDEQINKCSGRFTAAALSGQGTSAMKYYWYNIQMKKPKFTSKGCYNEETDEYALPETNPNNYLYNSKYYYMPDDTSNSIGIQKSCGKFNYASSMQSHKYGAIRAFHDLWDACVDKADYSEAEIKGRKTCLEDPFIVFYIESSLEDVSNFKPSDIQNTNDEDIKFAGFQTWGSAKGDKQTFGYSDDTPGYILLEGAENDGELCNWLTPWSPSIATLSGETWKTKYLEVSDSGEAIYNESDSFDVDYGLDDADESGNTMSAAANTTLQRFITAYNFVYMHTINLMPYTSKTSINEATGLDTTKKYYITSISYADNTYFKGAQWDVFRYDTYSKLWVPAGLPVLNEDGTQKLSTVKSASGTDVYEYETFNLKTFHESLGTTGSENISTYLNDLKTDFKNHFGEYFHVDDIVYHQAFIKLFAGTDNRAKNTYFKLFDENSKIQMLQDDMDTLLATDNRGLQKKPYYLLEPSQETDDTYKNMWGGKSAFFELVDIAYKTEIDNMISAMLQQMNFQNTESSLDTWMDKYFYFVQKYYPAVAYNYTARLAYEDAQVIFDNQSDFGGTWTNNGQAPLSQEHGSCLQSEISFMRKRFTMFLSQARLAMFGREGSGIPIKTKEDAQAAQTYTVKITPYQYLYLGYLSGSVSNLFSESRVAAGDTLSATINISNTTPSYYVLGNSYIQGFDNFSEVYYNSGEYTLNAPKLLEFSANNGKVNVLPSFQPPSLVLNCNVLEKLDLTNVQSLSAINLDSGHTPKLKEIILTGTKISNVTLPEGDRLTTIHFPAALTNLTITNNNGLTDVQFEGLNNLSTVNIDCSKVGSFDVANFCEQLIDCNNLSSITLKNANIYITEDALRKMILCNTCNLTGDIYIVTAAGGTTLKDISFATKQLLVNTFGNSDKLTFHYQSSEITEFSCAQEVSVYYQTGESGTITRQNMFNITVDSGNDVVVKSGTNPFNPSVDGYLDISYSMSGVTSDVATIDQTGAITLKKESTNTATVTISMNTTGGGIYKKQVTVSFAWKAPQLGDFAYADGTFTSSYDSNKTMVGLVYAKDETSDTEGTVYIIGKEYSDPDNSYYLGYSNDGDGQTDEGTSLAKLYQVQSFLDSDSVLGQNNTYETVTGINSKQTFINNINVSTYTTTANDQFSGAADTKLYVDHVNNNILTVLKSSSQYSSVCGSYINKDDQKYYINSLDNLNKLCSAVQDIYNSTGDFMSCILFPYFYSAYLYEPEVKEGETLNSAYTQGNWYMPSVNELSRVIYYRGYSVSGQYFNTSDVVRQAISTSVANGGTVLTTPIFSNAYAKAGNKFPTVWSNMVGSGDNAGVNNITTTVNASSANNYSYQRTIQYNSSGNTYSNEWVVGSFNDQSYWNTTQYNNCWRLTKHQGIPFTKFNYKKNG